MAKSKQQTQATNQVYSTLSFIVAAILLAFGFLAMWGYNFTGEMVKSELAAQKIYFPEAGSPALDPAVYPDLQQYAGQLVDTPAKAKAYANGYIGRHLEKVAGGKVYAEVSAESMKNPTDETLLKQKQTLFQGETLRGMLLTSGYGFGTIGNIAGITAVVAFLSAGALALLGLALRTKR